METFHIRTENLSKQIPMLHASDEIFLSGIIYTARDAAHKKIRALIETGGTLPFALKDAVIYYAGPTPAREGMAIGSCGPTTSSRMDIHTPLLMEHGLIGMIGKGERNKEVIEAIKKHRGIYFCALGGAGALAAMCIKSCEVIAFPELGCESVKKLTIEEFPLLVGIDCNGETIFK